MPDDDKLPTTPRMEQPLPESEGTNTLLLTSPPSDASRESCLGHLAATVHHPARALLITYPGRRTAQQWCRAWEQQDGEHPVNTRIVRVGDFTRSATPATADQGLSHPETPPIETVGDPANLTALGITINDLLADWTADEQSLRTDGIVVCFDSVTALLDHVDLQAAFRFLHVLLSRFAATGATTHFHLDTVATDDETVRTFRQLFDATVDALDR